MKGENMSGGLPKLNTAVYELTLPSTGKKVKFRPFLVKEYRALLTAKEENSSSVSLTTIKELVKVCTFDKVDVDNMSVVDLEFLVLKLRAKSIGEIIELFGKCSNCDAKTLVNINIDDITMKTEKVDYNVKIDDNVAVKMQYPTTKLVEEINSSKLDEFQIISKCITQVYFKDTVFNVNEFSDEETMEFVESMSKSQIEKLIAFVEAQPSLKHNVEFTCNACGTKNSFVVEGVDDFFT